MSNNPSNKFWNETNRGFIDFYMWKEKVKGIKLFASLLKEESDRKGFLHTMLESESLQKVENNV